MEDTDSQTLKLERHEGLLAMFGPQAVIENSERSDEWIIRISLVSGIAEGGQNVHIRLSRNLETGLLNDDQRAIFGYPANSVVVNGVEMSNIVKPIIFTPQQPGVEPGNMDRSHPLLKQFTHQSGSLAATSGGQQFVFLSSMQSGDDLVVLMHENAHFKVPDSTSEIFHHLERRVANGGEMPPYGKDAFLAALRSEAQVNKSAIDAIKNRGLNKRIFPTDHNLVRFKKSLTAHTLTYVGAAEGKFSQLVEAETINKIMDL